MPSFFTADDPSITGTTNFAQLASAYGGAMPSAGTGTAAALVPDEPLVFMGTRSLGFPVGYGDDVHDFTLKDPTPPPSRAQKLATLSQAIKKFDNMSFAEQRNMLRLLAIGGFAGSIPLDEIDEAIQQASQTDAREAYKALLESASEYFMATNAQVTPTDVLRSAIAYRLDALGVKWDGNLNAFDDGIDKKYLQAGKDKDALGLAEEEPLKPYSTTTTSRSVDLMNPKDAKGLTRAMLQSELGRDPTQAEYEDFLSALHAAERQNPNVTRTTSNYEVDPTGDGLYLASQTSRTREGIGAEGLAQVAYEQAQSNPNWAEWQAMGTYFPALLNALGATVPGA